MQPICQRELPTELHGAPGLPGVGPCDAEDWLRVDDAYAGQMARRAALIAGHRDTVIALLPQARDAAEELLDAVLALLPGLGFAVSGDVMQRPDGLAVTVDRSDPMGSLGALVQEDLCILQKQGDEHVLTAATLCFPASWRLSEKIGRPLSTIHDPVGEYDANIARRVQRLFDGVRAGRPLWRFNKLWYDDPELHQPRSAQEPRRIAPGQATAPFIRSERQCILRLPRTNAAIFSIHTYVVRSGQAEGTIPPA